MNNTVVTRQAEEGEEEVALTELSIRHEMVTCSSNTRLLVILHLHINPYPRVPLVISLLSQSEIRRKTLSWNRSPLAISLLETRGGIQGYGLIGILAPQAKIFRKGNKIPCFCLFSAGSSSIYNRFSTVFPLISRCFCLISWFLLNIFLISWLLFLFILHLHIGILAPQAKIFRNGNKMLLFLLILCWQFLNILR